MTPACLDLPIVSGATNRKPLWLLQPVYLYRAISEIQQTAPLRLTVPGHDLPADWPVWIEGVSGWGSLNRAPGREAFRMAMVVDENTIEFNDLNGTAQRASGGHLVYQAPVDLAGCTGRLELNGGDAPLVLTTENGGLVIEGLGQLLIVLTAEQSAGLTWTKGTYTLDLTMSNGDVMRWLAGSVIVSNGGACHGGCS